MLDNDLEIIVVVSGDSKPRNVKFEDLYDLKKNIESLMLLWNTNCYYVSRDKNTFLINGGKRLMFPKLGTTDIEYRRRSTMHLSTASMKDQPSRTYIWIVGLKSKESNSLLLLEVDSTGASWKWKTTL